MSNEQSDKWAALVSAIIVSVCIGKLHGAVIGWLFFGVITLADYYISRLIDKIH